MIIKSLEIQNFRNYKKEKINFHNGINILYGDNAQGKTNILEAIYISSTSKSHRTSNDKEVIKFKEEESYIKINTLNKYTENRIDINIKKNKKGIALNKNPIKKLREIMGINNIVFFSPEDLKIIKNSPSERRKFIDLQISQLDKIYFINLIEYNKIIKNRNELLKEINKNSENKDVLDIIDLLLEKKAKEIISKRESFIKEINKIISDIQLYLTDNKEKLKIKYEKNIEENLILEKLRKNREKDIYYKNTTVGPHKDDLSFFIINENEEIDARKYASQGQQRTISLSLKLSEIEIVNKIKKEYPILLLDDVLSELDFKRQKKLLDKIKNIQTIITCTGIEDFKKLEIENYKIFKINAGKIIECY